MKKKTKMNEQEQKDILVENGIFRNKRMLKSWIIGNDKTIRKRFLLFWINY